MPASSIRRRGFPAARVIAMVLASALGLALAAALPLALALPAAAAPATQGSVPTVVSDYVTAPDGLVARLDDLFGKTADGEGLDLGAATTGEIDRAFGWRDDFAAGSSGATAITLLNEWTTTISVDGKPVGFATIFINPDSGDPDLADFAAGADLGLAFAALPADVSLIHDSAHTAWFTLAGTTLTAVVPGDSGVTSSTTLDAYQRVLAQPAVATPAGSNQGTINSVIVIVVAVIAVGAIVFFVGRRRRASTDD